MRAPRNLSVCRAARLLLVFAVGVASFGLNACSAPDRGLHLVGTVADTLTVVVVPAVGMPGVDLEAGFIPPTSSGSGAGAALGSVAGSVAGSGAGSAVGSGRATSVAIALTGLGTVLRVATTSVREGTRVAAGDPVVTLDDRILVAQVEVAKAAALTAAAQGPVLADRIHEVDDKRAELADRDRTLAKALATIASTRTTLTGTKSQLTANRTTLVANRAGLAATRAGLLSQQTALVALLATLPSDPSIPLPPGTPTRPEVQAQLAAVTAGIAKADGGLTQLDAGLAKVTTGLAQLADGLAQLTSKEREVRTGRETIAEGRATLADARRHLVALQTLADIAAQTASLAVTLAEQQRALTVVTTPVSGVVVATTTAGSLLPPGGVLLTIRADEPAVVTGWLAAAPELSVCLGNAARIRGDWMPPGTHLAATVTRIGDRADYPPSSHASDEVHLLRAVPVELTVPGWLPPGVPVDVVVDGCRVGST